MDATNGATANRYSLSGELRRADAGGSWLAQAYLRQNDLDLYSNFEYAPQSQFNQRGSRVTTGLNLARSWNIAQLGEDATNTLDVQVQTTISSIRSAAPPRACRMPTARCRAMTAGRTM